MIQFKTATSKISAYLLVALLGLTAFSSCKKNDDHDFEATVTANVQLVNASTDAGPANLYISKALRTTAAVNYGAASGYSQTYVGQADVSIQGPSGTVLASTSTSLDAMNNYTFFLVGASDSRSVIVAHDDTQAASSGKAKVKFVQAAPGLTSAGLLANGTALFTAQAYKGVSSSTEVAAGTYVFAVVNAGSTAPLATSASVTLKAGGNYTVYTSGNAGVTGANALAVGVLTIN